MLFKTIKRTAINMKNGKHVAIVLAIAIMVSLCLSVNQVWGIDFYNVATHVTVPDRSPAWYNNDWMTNSKFSPEFEVLDTESALGRYATMTKTITLKDMIKFHGHACDGLIMGAAGIRLALDELFPEGIIDRTDLRIISKNGPCFMDASAYLTGGRINFGTLDIDGSLGVGWIVQRISTGKTVKSSLRDGVFPKELAAIEKKIRAGKGTSEDLTYCRDLAWVFSKDLLAQPLSKSFSVKILKNFSFPESDYPKVGKRGDIIQKNTP